jgi:hypothetical protein
MNYEIWKEKYQYPENIGPRIGGEKEMHGEIFEYVININYPETKLKDLILNVK